MAENKAKNTEKNKSNNHKNNKPKKTYKKTDGVKKDKKSYNHSKKTITKKSTEKKAKKPAKPLHIIPLGGLGEIGKNITVYEYDGDMFLVDCGMSFPDEEMPGIDIVIPDFSFIEKNADRIKGLVLTHGHEDHIGAIPYLFKVCKVPIFGTSLTLGLVEGKLKEHHLLDSAERTVVKPGDKIKLGKFNLEFIHVNHSIPDAIAIAIETPAGVVVQTGDFKIDTTPIDGEVIDLARETEDRGERSELYRMAMGYVLDLAIELPVYQRDVLYAYNSKVIDPDSMPDELNPYTSPLDHIWDIEFAD